VETDLRGVEQDNTIKITDRYKSSFFITNRCLPLIEQAHHFL
jgi:hypothetical protein